MQGHRIGRLAALAMSSTALTCPAGALAQEAAAFADAPAQTASAEATEVGEIVVTARRRSESLQDVPLAVAAFDEQTIERANVRTLFDLQQIAPSLNFGGRSSARPQLYIRGVGTEQFTNVADPAIGVFIDDIYVPRTSGLLTAISDIERIEVLRGPQGTLYGRNTIAGAIKVVTADPGDELRTRAEASYGNRDEILVRGSMAGPLTDALGLRIGGYYRREDGYLRNLTTGARGNGDDTFLLDGKLVWQATDTLRVTLGGLYSETDAGGEYAKSTSGRPTLISPLAPTAVLDPNPYADRRSLDSRLRRDQGQAYLRVVADTGIGELTSITAWRDSTVGEIFDQDATELDIWLQESTERSESLTQEVRLASTDGSPLTFGGRVAWILGFFYLDEATSRSTRTNFGRDSVSVLLARRARLISGTDFDATADFDLDVRSYAAFGSATISMIDTLSVTLGARWTSDEKRADLRGRTAAPGIPPAPNSFAVEDAEVTASAFDPRVSLEWQPTDNLLVYASYATGFRSGGFQALPTSATVARTPYLPEEVEAFEAGIKATVADGDATLNLGAFRYNYSNMQMQSIQEIAPGILQSLVSNAGRAQLQGIEVEGRARLTRWADVGLSYSWLDAEYIRFENPPIPDLDGTRLPRAPEHQVRADVTLRWSPASGQKIIFRGDVAWQSRQFLFFGEGRVPFTTQDDFALLNGRLSYEFDDGRVGISLYGRNITDQRYLTGTNQFGGPPVVQYYSAPRSYGLALTYRFN